MLPRCSMRAAIPSGARACTSACATWIGRMRTRPSNRASLERLVAQRAGAGPRRLPRRPRDRLGQPGAADGLRPPECRQGCWRRSTTSRSGRSSASSCRAARAARVSPRRCWRPPSAMPRHTARRPWRLIPWPLSAGASRRPDAFHGTQSMFETRRFLRRRGRRWNATTPPRPIMRLELANATQSSAPAAPR